MNTQKTQDYRLSLYMNTLYMNTQKHNYKLSLYMNTQKTLLDYYIDYLYT